MNVHMCKTLLVAVCFLSYSSYLSADTSVVETLVKTGSSKSFTAIGIVSNKQPTSLILVNANGSDGTKNLSYSIDFSSSRMETRSYVPLTEADIHNGDKIVAQGVIVDGAISARRLISFSVTSPEAVIATTTPIATSTPVEAASTTDIIATTTPVTESGTTTVPTIDESSDEPSVSTTTPEAATSTESVHDTATTTSPTEEVATTTPPAGTATTTEPVATTTPEIATSTDPVATTTEPIIEESTSTEPVATTTPKTAEQTPDQPSDTSTSSPIILTKDAGEEIGDLTTTE